MAGQLIESAKGLAPVRRAARPFVAGGLWALALALVAASADARSCSEGWVCVEPEENANGEVAFYVRNLQPYPVTLSLEARLDNLDSTGPNPVTRTVAGGSREAVMTVAPVDERQRTWYRYWFDWTVGDRDARHDDGYIYRLPYERGKRYRILQGYGSSFSHTGREHFTVDFDMSVGTPVHAARDGVVARVVEKHDKGCWRDGCGRYANFVVILHDDGTTGEYYHLRRNGALVTPGDRVERGQHIAYSGNTGHTTMPHLHFGVYRAADWGRTESLSVRFDTNEGVVERVRRGAGHTAR